MTTLHGQSEWVIHFEPDQDIEVIGGDLDYGLLERLPASFDRFKAARHFTLQLESLSAAGRAMEAEWYFRAALAEFQAFGEIFSSDLPNVSLKKIWDRSEISADLKQHELLSVLEQTRNLSLHTARLPCIVKDQKVICLPGGETNVTSLFINAIHPDYDNRSSRLVEEHRLWFNRQTERLAAHHILREALFISCAARTNFLSMNPDLLE